MNEKNMRKALEVIGTKPANEAVIIVRRLLREALAQPTEAVELTSHELYKAYDNGVSKAIDAGTASISHLYGLKYVIAAHEAKRSQS